MNLPKTTFKETIVQVQEFYKTHWTDYPLELEGVVKHLQDIFPDGVRDRRVLDGGCGSGMVSVGFATQGADVTGVDVTKKCVENGRSNAERFGVDCCFVEADLVDLDLGAKFDIIYSWGVLHHTPDAKASFQHLASHLAPGGEMIIAVYLKTALSGFWNFSRVFYQNSPEFAKMGIRKTTSGFLGIVDMVKRVSRGRERYMMRGTSNEEIINDWLGVPHRTFHTYDEVYKWFEDAGFQYTLANPATGRFKSTSNFVVRGTKPTVPKIGDASSGMGEGTSTRVQGSIR